MPRPFDRPFGKSPNSPDCQSDPGWGALERSWVLESLFRDDCVEGMVPECGGDPKTCKENRERSHSDTVSEYAGVNTRLKRCACHVRLRLCA